MRIVVNLSRPCVFLYLNIFSKEEILFIIYCVANTSFNYVPSPRGPKGNLSVTNTEYNIVKEFIDRFSLRDFIDLNIFCIFS